MPMLDIPITSATPVVTSGQGYAAGPGYGGYGGYNNYGGCGFGGTALAAGLGAVVGNLLLPNGFHGGHYGGNYGGGYAGGAAYNHEDILANSLRQEFIMNKLGDIQYEIPKQTTELQHDYWEGRLAASNQNCDLAMQLQECCCENGKGIALLGKDVALSTKDVEKTTLIGDMNLQAAIKDCCCETQTGLQRTAYQNELLTQKTGYETMLNDMRNTAAINANINSVERALADCCCETQLRDCQNTGMLMNKINDVEFKQLLGVKDIENKLAACCCDTNLNIERQGSETRYRDLENKCSTDKQLEEIKCLIKTTEDRSIMREQGAKISALEAEKNKLEIIAAMKPVAPIPAYVVQSPYATNVVPDFAKGFGHGFCNPCAANF